MREAASLSSTGGRARASSSTTRQPPSRTSSTQAQGRTVQVGQTDVRLDTAGLTIQEFEPDWRTRLLSVDHRSGTIALILMMAVLIYGIIFEFSPRGHLSPATIGGICLLLGLYALALLPVSFAGVGLIVLRRG